MKVAQLLVELACNTATFMSDMRTTAKVVEDVAGQMKSALNTVQGALGAIAVFETFKKVIEEAGQAGEAFNQVTAVIRSTGSAAGVSVQQCQDLADSLERMTGIDGDTVMSMESVLLTFTKVGKTVFPEATQAIVDLSARLKMDLQSAAIMVGKALNDPVNGMIALKKAGVSLDDEQKNMVKNFMKSNDILSAQKVILAELKKENDGAAAAARNNLGGAMKALQTSVGNVYEALGGGNNGGLRYALEFTVQAMNNVVPIAKELGLAIEEFARNGVRELNEWYPTLNGVVTWFANAAQVVLRISMQMGEALNSLMSGDMSGLANNLAEIPKIVQTAWVKDALNPIKANITDTKKQLDDFMADLKKKADSYKPPTPIFGDTSDPSAKKKKKGPKTMDGFDMEKVGFDAGESFVKGFKEFTDGQQKMFESVEKLGFEAGETISKGFEKAAEEQKKMLDTAADMEISMREEVDMLRLKVEGRTSEIPLVRQIAQIQKQIDDPKIQQVMIAYARQKNAEYQKLTVTLKQEEQEVQRIMSSTASAAKKALMLNDAFAMGKINVEQLDDNLAKVANKTDTLKTVGGKLMDVMTGAFDAMIEGGKSFIDVIKDIVIELAKAVVKAMLLAAVTMLFKKPDPGGLSGLARFADLLKSGLLKGFAGGGNPPVGEPYWVGENGPELKIDRTASTIIPMDKLASARNAAGGGMSQPMQVIVNNNAGAKVSVKQSFDPDGRRRLMFEIDQLLTQAARENSSDLVRWLQGQTGLQFSGAMK